MLLLYLMHRYCFLISSLEHNKSPSPFFLLFNVFDLTSIFWCEDCESHFICICLVNLWPYFQLFGITWFQVCLLHRVGFWFVIPCEILLNRWVKHIYIYWCYRCLVWILTFCFAENICYLAVLFCVLSW